MAAVIASGVVPAAVEWLDRQGIAGLQQFYDTAHPLDAEAIVLIDIDGTAAEVARDQPIVEKVLRERATEVRIAVDEKSRTALWYGRLNAPNSVKQSGNGFFIGDVTVPRQHIPDMQEAVQAAAARHADALLFIAVTGHAGDGDLHPATFFDKDNPKAAAALEAANNEIIEAALGMGGTDRRRARRRHREAPIHDQAVHPGRDRRATLHQARLRLCWATQSRNHASRSLGPRSLMQSNLPTPSVTLSPEA